MKLIFVSNILNHHQIELCKEFQKQFDDFYFVTTEDVDTIGYQLSQDAKYVLHYYDSNEKEKVKKEIIEADVVIFGSCPNDLISLRMEYNKLSFLYSEHFLKKGAWRLCIPRTRKKIMKRIGQYSDKNMYVLCASAYTAYDLSLIGFPKEKCFKWGYFPEMKNYKTKELLEMKKNKKFKILWVGRFLDWKHPELAIKLAEKLRNNKIIFEMIMIGDGPSKEKIRKLLEKKELKNYVHLVGTKTPLQVREYMEKANMFLMTSNYYEGWGAVINEAMNSGCAVLASHTAGATPYLIDDGLNGAVFKFPDINMLYAKTKKYIESTDYLKRTQIMANKSISDIWNAKNAALNFKELVNLINEDRKNCIEFGPCSPAEILKKNWYKG